MARLAIGMLRRIQNRLAFSRVELETAIALDRNNARAFRQLGQTMMFLGQPEAAIPHIEKAIQLNPRDPNIAIEYRALGLCHLFLGGVDEAIELLTKARAANPRIWSMHLYLAGALGFGGDLGEAQAAGPMRSGSNPKSTRLRACVRSVRGSTGRSTGHCWKRP